jgi:hypothetical protein
MEAENSKMLKEYNSLLEEMEAYEKNNQNNLKAKERSYIE